MIVQNQRVISSPYLGIDEAAEWLDGLIGNSIPDGRSTEVVAGIVNFQIVPIRPNYNDYEKDFVVIAVISTEADIPDVADGQGNWIRRSPYLER
jgi:hypothetical protein